MKSKKNTFLLPLNLQFFSEEQPTEVPADPTPAEAPKTEEVPTPVQDEKTIPYDRFKKVNDDLKSFKQTFESLGLESVDSLKSLVDDYNQRKQQEDERKRAEMGELDLLKTDLQTITEAKTNAETELQKLQAKFRDQAIKNEFLLKASNVNIPSDRIDAALKLADLSSVKFEDDKVVGIDDVLAALVEQNSFLVAETKKPQREIGGPSNNSLNDEAKTLEAQIEEAKKNKEIFKVIQLTNQLNKIGK